MPSGAWNLDSDLKAGKLAYQYDIAKRQDDLELEAKQIGTNNIVSIQKVRPVENDSYTPHRVPIGPYHRNCSSSLIEKEKLRYVGFMQTISEKYKGLQGLVEKLEHQAREWYGDGVADMTPEELARMLLRDGCYLLGWLVKYPVPPQEVPASCNDHNTVFRDILYLIENQIPFFVLDKIHACATGDTSCLIHYLAGYIHGLLQPQGYISSDYIQKQMADPPKLPCHLLHLVHTCFHPTNLQPSTELQPLQQMADPPKLPCHLLQLVHTYFHPPNLQPSTELQPLQRPNSLLSTDSQQPERTGRWRRATEYRMDANVKFMPRCFAAGVTSVLDVHLEGGTLWIPCLQVDSKTWTLLRNLMALEEQIPKRPVTAYCIFMSQVACSVEDVRLLVDAEIVQNFLGSDEIAAQGFADLSKGVVMDVDNIDRNYLKPIWHQLEKLCRSRWRNFKGSFRQTYCSKGLHRVAFGITAFLALCQLLQAIYAPIEYHFPKN